MKLARLLAIIAFAGFLPQCSDKIRPTDYDLELAGIDDSILNTKARLASAAVKENPMIELISLLYHRSSLTGDFEHYRITETAINDAIRDLGASPALYYFRAHVNSKLHRLQDTKEDIAAFPALADAIQVQALLADMALAEGRYAEAEAGYEKIIKDQRTWDGLARLAYLRSKTGDPASAEQLYEEALAEITAKEMRAYAWVELQRGILDLEHGRYDEARAHYQTADRAYSGYWLIEEHIAEVRSLLGQTEQAIALYKEIIRKTDHPQFLAALASLLEGEDAQESARLRIRADELYTQQMALYPEAAIGHVIDYLLQKEGTDHWEELLKFARENYRLRPNSESKFLLAQSYFKMNDTAVARELLREIAETPWRTPEISKMLNAMN